MKRVARSFHGVIESFARVLIPSLHSSLLNPLTAGTFSTITVNKEEEKYILLKSKMPDNKRKYRIIIKRKRTLKISSLYSFNAPFS